MKTDYMTRLERWARWMLPHQEAEDVIADYRDIVGTPPRPEEELVRELGKPKDAVRPLTTTKTYYTWLAVFAALVVCIWLLGISPLPLGPYMIYMYCFDWFELGRVVAFFGAVGAIVWFRRKGYKAEKLPRAVSILLAVLLVWLAVVLGAQWAWMHDPLGFSEMWGRVQPHILWMRIGPAGYTVSRSVGILGDALEWGGGLGMAVIGIVALVKARTKDRRWAAVYVLAFTAMVVSLEALALMCNMAIDGIPTWENFFSSYFYAYTALTAVGLVGTGVALC